MVRMIFVLAGAVLLVWSVGVWGGFTANPVTESTRDLAGWVERVGDFLKDGVRSTRRAEPLPDPGTGARPGGAQGATEAPEPGGQGGPTHPPVQREEAVAGTPDETIPEPAPLVSHEESSLPEAAPGTPPPGVEQEVTGVATGGELSPDTEGRQGGGTLPAAPPRAAPASRRLAVAPVMSREPAEVLANVGRILEGRNRR